MASQTFLVGKGSATAKIIASSTGFRRSTGQRPPVEDGASSSTLTSSVCASLACCAACPSCSIFSSCGSIFSSVPSPCRGVFRVRLHERCARLVGLGQHQDGVIDVLDGETEIELSAV